MNVEIGDIASGSIGSPVVEETEPEGLEVESEDAGRPVAEAPEPEDVKIESEDIDTPVVVAATVVGDDPPAVKPGS
jgi:hypothetical protein